jgi:hypothetical protein
VAAANAAELLTLVGFVTGAALYAMLLALVLRTPQPERRDRLPLATALLGLVWNLGELASYAAPRLGQPTAAATLTALSFPALGLLAAVVVHSVARGLPFGWALAVAAYGCSTVATGLHLGTLVTGDQAASSFAFTLLTVAYGLTILPLAWMTRTQPNGRRALWILALAGFAVSANHLGRFHGEGGGGWVMELIGHHAAIPLAFAILYQDYRFALADLFLKQALSLLALVALALGGYWLVSALPGNGPLAVGALLAGWVGTALVYPGLRRAIGRFVDAVLLGRDDYARLRADMAQAVQAQSTVAGVLDSVAAHLAPALSARRVWWTEGSAATATAERVSAAVDVPTTDAPAFRLHVGELTGGRRLLSDDRAVLDAVALLAGRRIDAVRLTHERYEQRLREEEMERLAAEAELRALRAQINPHFLFNALTTIGYLIESAPPRALQTLLRLTALLRGVLRSDGEFTTLGREIELVEHYLDIERERFEERLDVTVDVPAALRALRIPCLVLQPLVENAIKHGVAPAVKGGAVEVLARLERRDGGSWLRLRVRNTGAPLGAELGTAGGRVGLANVEHRLAGHYGGAARFELGRDGGWTVAEIVLPVEVERGAAAPAARAAAR